MPAAPKWHRQLAPMHYYIGDVQVNPATPRLYLRSTAAAVIGRSTKPLQVVRLGMRSTGGNARDDGGTGGGLAALKNLLVESDGERRSPARKGYLRQCGYATRVDDGRLHVQRARRRVQVSPRGHSLRRDPELLGESACALSVSSREAADQMGWAWARRIPPTTPARNTRSRPMSSRTSSTAG